MMQKNFFSRTIVLFMSALAVFLLVFTILVNSTGVFTSLSSPVVSVFSKVDSVISKPFSFLLDLNGNISSLFSTFSENQSLKSENASLKEGNVETSDLESKVEELEGLLNLDSSLSANVKASAEVVSRTPVSWLEKVTVNKGSKAGIEEGMLALSSSGLVGYVSDVTSNSSTVELLTNSSNNNSISMKISTGSGDVYGILTGYDSETKSFVISQLNNSTTISVGDSVVTSGLDGSSISGVSLGSVSKVEVASDSLKTKVYVSSDVDFDDFSYVTIVGD
ncbi:rod shape-determining protein MreC [Streptococcus loxodontisalivarius]|uniref:Cell shape-determining protein MreC n=1 Tax=Streptococcus loxodontisalivarius TaxID=1349415 RepID=A0ABS2PWC8_9STRE|nr:rod shape-determining protein MreC [Streptococcus loxodontisalivarius]MBM7643774.1 rod shape-determining protein MreC [Streptococcus loxodontisalivarius]